MKRFTVMYLVVAPLALLAQVLAPGGSQGSASRGAELFRGTVRFANGAPACGACHTVAAIPFPNGGSLGPDLTRAYSRFGPQGTKIVLNTLYFPTMAPIFREHPLNDQEQADLYAFLQSVNGKSGPAGLEIIFALIAIGGGLVLLAITALAGKGRVHSVRRAMLARAMPPRHGAA